MQTNELVAGVRSDVGIILYGPDLEILRTLGQGILEQIRGIPGSPSWGCGRS
ncbi:MAG: hypothetical protein JNK56_23690 [Myxococcales bacterium]|nr:hypothetical protein [Myxococcales bacterium]